MIWTYYWTYLLIIPGLILSLFAQLYVKSAYKKNEKRMARSGWCAENLAQRLLLQHNCNVSVQPIQGNLTDNYNPQTGILSLSKSSYGRSSISALAITAHEVGHAVQHEEDYFLLKLRSVIVPVVNFGSKLAIPLVLVGVVLEYFSKIGQYGEIFIFIGILAYSLSTIFSLLTLPVEINASRRAIAMLKENDVLEKDEIGGAKQVLTAAAFTYIASTFVSILYLLRFLLIVSQFRKRK